MKKFQVIISGPHEEEIGHMILSGIYEAVKKFGYTDVSVNADTIGQYEDLQIPDFLKKYRKGNLESLREATGR